ncbi:MAG: hypothetical protein U9N85_02435 [Bacteroidota bacterium]|nr:hypothetical protein [Bacteroidota bacterium]
MYSKSQHIYLIISISILLNTFFTNELQAQHILLGKSLSSIKSFYDKDPEYTIRIDTINSRKLLISCQSSNIYPSHTYEIDRLMDRCITYGFISRNEDVLNTYVEILDHSGSLINSNENFSQFTYMLDLPDKQIFYTIKRPYYNSSLKIKRKIFYIVITEERKKLQVGR